MSESADIGMSPARVLLQQCRLAESPDCPREQLEAYLKDTSGLYHRMLRKSAWSNPTLTREQYEEGIKLFSDYTSGNYYSDRYHIREGLLFNTGMPGDLIVTVPEIEFRILHPNCPHTELVRIATEETFPLKKRMAHKRNLTEDIQMLMSHDTDAKVRAHLARNNTLTATVILDWYPRETRLPILRSLALRRNAKDFRDNIITLLNTLIEERGTSNARNNKLFNARYSSDQTTLTNLVATGDELLAEIVLQNKAIDAETLATVAITNPNGRLRKKAAANKKCPDEGKVAQALRACTCGHWNCHECTLRTSRRR